MLNKLNQIISRILIVTILVSLTLMVINTTLLHNKKFESLSFQVTAALFFIWISIPLIISAAISYPRACNRFKMKVWRYAIKVRKYYKLTPINTFILYVGSIFSLISASIIVFFKSSNTFFTLLPIIIMSISFSIDFYNRTTYILKKVWSGVLGKGIIALLATLSFIISNFLARHWLYTTTNIDPKYFSDFNSIMSLFFTPIAYLILVGVTSLVIVTPEFIVIFLISLLPPLKNILFAKTFMNLEQLLVRLRTGKRIEKLTSSEVVLLNSRVLFFRFFSSISFIGLVFFSFSFMSQVTGSFWDSTARLGLVTYYYNNDEVKNNQPYIRYYNYDGEKRSQAFYKGDRWEFILLDKNNNP